MPQLLPDPWFFIFLISWTILLSIAPNKILHYTFPNNFHSDNLKMANLTWPWLW